MRTKVAEGAYAGLLHVGHPQPLRREDVAQCAAVTADKAGARDLPKNAPGDQFPEALMRWDAALEVAGLEEDAGLLDRSGHAVCVPGPHAQRLFHEQMLARRGPGEHQRLVPVGLGADNHALNRTVFPDRVEAGYDGRVELRRAAFSAGWIMVPDRDRFDIVASLQPPDKTGRVDVGAADQCDRCHLQVLQLDSG